MLQNLRGYNIIYGLWRTQRRERGLAGPPNDFYRARGDPGTELDYEQFCALLEQNGINWLRVKLVGWQNPIGSIAASFEPPPAGTFNLWQSALDPAYLSIYRSDQVPIPIPPDIWEESNFGQFILAAERHGIKLNVIVFDNREFRDGWIKHAWNVNNQYLDGRRCEPEDRGFMADERQIFTNPEAIAAARARIDGILAVFEGHESALGSWEIMAEQTALATPDWLGTDGWNAEFTRKIREIRDWNDLIAQYIHEHSDAPAGISHAFENAVRRDSVRAELYDAPSLGWIGINMYGHNATQAQDWLRVAQARYPDAQIVVQQYHPNGTSASAENAPYKESKRVEWAVACGSPGFIGPLRWPETNSGTYATPELQEIAGVTGAMGQAIAGCGWSGEGRPWDERISAPWASSWGDGSHVSAVMRWPESGVRQVTVSGLLGTSCVVRGYNYLDGSPYDPITVPVASGNAVFDVQVRDGYGVAFICPEDAPPPQDKRTLDVRAVFNINGQPQGLFEGTLTEVEP